VRPSRDLRYRQELYEIFLLDMKMKTFFATHNKLIKNFVNISLKLCVYRLTKTSLIKQSKRTQCATNQIRNVQTKCSPVYKIQYICLNFTKLLKIEEKSKSCKSFMKTKSLQMKNPINLESVKNNIYKRSYVRKSRQM